MRKSIIFLLLSILLTTSCSERTEFTLKGQLTGWDSDTLLVIHQLPDYKTDTLLCRDGKFEYTFIPDTFTMFSLVFNADESLPVFADKGETVEVKGSVTEPILIGKGENQLMNNILTLLRDTPEKQRKNKADSLIRANTHSFTNLYLIDKYYTYDEEPDYNRIKELLDMQFGSIKDSPSIMALQARLESINGKSKGQSIHSLTAFDREGNSLKWNNIRGKYILLDFWAGWHPESVSQQDSLTTVLKALRKENFLIVSLSLDVDKETWLKASARDTTQWKQVCDFKGWSNPIVRGQGICRLPANLLLDKNKRIIARDIRGQELIDKVKDLLRKDKEREKEQKARKRTR